MDEVVRYRDPSETETPGLYANRKHKTNGSPTLFPVLFERTTGNGMRKGEGSVSEALAKTLRFFLSQRRKGAKQPLHHVVPPLVTWEMTIPPFLLYPQPSDIISRRSNANSSILSDRPTDRPTDIPRSPTPMKQTSPLPPYHKGKPSNLKTVLDPPLSITIEPSRARKSFPP